MKCKCIKPDILEWAFKGGMIYNVHKKGDKYMIEEAGIGIDSAAFHERFKLLEEQETMETKYLYLYKVSAKHTTEVYVAAENQYEAALKAKDNEVFKDEDPSQMSIKFVDMVTV